MRKVLVVIVVALATALHAAAWFLLKDEVSPPNTNGALASVSFAPIHPHKDGEADYVTEEQIRSDLAAIAPQSRGHPRHCCRSRHNAGDRC